MAGGQQLQVDDRAVLEDVQESDGEEEEGGLGLLKMIRMDLNYEYKVLKSLEH